MNDSEIKSLLRDGTIATYSFDPKHRSEITRDGLNAATREARKHLAAKHRVTILVVREGR